jgi:L-alanine-DL-glutamate epimerase-like enolase superfamily enzyme
VIPHFLGKDARNVESLVDAVYIANYKLSGHAFWRPVAYVEQRLFDLLGKTTHKQAAALMGGVLRKEISVYPSGSGRDTTAEEEADVYVKGVEYTGAKAVKFKIGGRVSANRDAYLGRTDKLLDLAAKRLGGKVTLMADVNGSSSAAKAIRNRQEGPGATADSRGPPASPEWHASETFGSVRTTRRPAPRPLIFARRCGHAEYRPLHGVCLVSAEEERVVVFAELRNSHGVIPLPAGPGLGLEFDADFVKKSTVVKS